MPYQMRSVLCLVALCTLVCAFGTETSSTVPRCMCCFNLRPIFTPSKCVDYGYHAPDVNGECGLIGGALQRCNDEATVCSGECDSIPPGPVFNACFAECTKETMACVSAIFVQCDRDPSYIACRAIPGHDASTPECETIRVTCVQNAP